MDEFIQFRHCRSFDCSVVKPTRKFIFVLTAAFVIVCLILFNMDSSPTCVFCSIIAKHEGIVFQDEDIFVINDIKPAAKHHLLVIPRRHIIDAKYLTKEDIPLLKTMIERAKILLQERQIDEDESRLVFHWPPFHSVSHLHLHVIAPISDMSFFSRLAFKPNTWWAVTPEYVLERISKL